MSDENIWSAGDSALVWSPGCPKEAGAYRLRSRKDGTVSTAFVEKGPGGKMLSHSPGLVSDLTVVAHVRIPVRVLVHERNALEASVQRWKQAAVTHDAWFRKRAVRRALEGEAYNA